MSTFQDICAAIVVVLAPLGVWAGYHLAPFIGGIFG